MRVAIFFPYNVATFLCKDGRNTAMQDLLNIALQEILKFSFVQQADLTTGY